MLFFVNISVTELANSTKNLWLSLPFFCTLSITSQVPWKPVDANKAGHELDEINKQIFKLEKYSYNVVYKSYKGHFTKEVFEEKKGRVIKDGVYYKSVIMGKTIVQNKSLRVIIDTDNKIIKVNNPTGNEQPEFDAGTISEAFKNYRLVQSANINELKAYRFDMKSQRGVVAQEFFFNSLFIKQLVIYYANLHTIRHNNEIKEEVVYPRLSIEFYNFDINQVHNKAEFDTSPYITLNHNKLILDSKYSKYKLIDGRYTN